MIPRQESNNSQKGMHGGSWQECLLIYGVIHTYKVQSTYMHSRAAEDGRAYRICSDILCTQINSLFLAGLPTGWNKDRTS